VLYFWKDIDVSLREIAAVLKPGRPFGIAVLDQSRLGSRCVIPAEFYHFPAFADLTAALERMALNVLAGTDCANGPVLLLAEKRPPRAASEASHITDQADAILARRAIT